MRIDMAVYKDEINGTWRAVYRFTDWTGKRRQTQKRGFITKRDAQAWEREQLRKLRSSLDMTFDSFIEIYCDDVKGRIKLSTWETKEHMIRTKILPYFKDKKLEDIQPKDIIAWQNMLLLPTANKGKPYSPSYLKSVHSQLSGIFNHAVRFYNLQENPAVKVGNMCKSRSKEMLFWTQDEYLRFADAMMDKPLSYYAFEMLYWCGIREGELLALTPSDFNFEANTVSITKTYMRYKGQDIITSPKTAKSNRTISLPAFLSEEMQDCIDSLYDVGEDDRIFQVSKHYLKHEMERGCRESGVKRIRIHDLRHSHVSLLIQMGYSAVAIADRVGHESIEITYRYAHLFPSMQRDMAEKLDGLRKGEADDVS